MKTLETVIKEEERKNEETWRKSVWCRKHGFELEAKALSSQHEAIKEVLYNLKAIKL